MIRAIIAASILTVAIATKVPHGVIAIPYHSTDESIAYPDQLAATGDGSLWIGVRAGTELLQLRERKRFAIINLAAQLDGGLIDTIVAVGSNQLAVSEFVASEAPSEGRSEFVIVDASSGVAVRRPTSISHVDELADAGHSDLWVLDNSDSVLARITIRGNVLHTFPIGHRSAQQLVACDGRPWWFGIDDAHPAKGRLLTTLRDKTGTVIELPPVDGADAPAYAPACVGRDVVFGIWRANHEVLTYATLHGSRIDIAPLRFGVRLHSPISTSNGAIWALNASGDLYRARSWKAPFIRIRRDVSEVSYSTCYHVAFCDLSEGETYGIRIIDP